MSLIDCEDNGLADLSGWVSLCFAQKSFAHDTVAMRGKNLPFKVINLKIIFLLTDNNCPACVLKRLRGDVRAAIDDLWEA